MRAYRHLAELMKALAHPVRLQILELLEQEGEACVCHLEAHLNQRQAYISQQLGRLRDAGLVRDRREGLNVYYALSSEAISLLLEQAKRAASAISSTQGAELKFKPISAAKLDDCACPKCQQAIARVEVG